MTRLLASFLMLGAVACTETSAPPGQPLDEFATPGAPARIVIGDVSYGGGSPSGIYDVIDSAAQSYQRFVHCASERGLTDGQCRPVQERALSTSEVNDLFVTVTSAAFKREAGRMTVDPGDGLTVRRYFLQVTAGELRYEVNLNADWPAGMTRFVCRVRDTC